MVGIPLPLGNEYIGKLDDIISIIKCFKEISPFIYRDGPKVFVSPKISSEF
jgi:hypothetical protein